MIEQPSLRLLLVEDPAQANRLASRLAAMPRCGFHVTQVSSVAAAMAHLQGQHCDVVVINRAADDEGVDVLRQLQQACPDCAYLVFSAAASDATAAAAPPALDAHPQTAPALADLIWSAAAHHTLQKEQHQLQQLVAHLPDALIVADMHGVVQFANHAALAAYGRSRESSTNHVLSLVVAEGQWVEIDLWHGPDRRSSDVYVTTITWDQAPSRLMIIRDTTAQKALIDQLQQLQKIEALGRLAGGVAHDFNNVLAIIEGNVAKGTASLAPAHPAQQALAEIGQAAQRASDMVQQVLSFSRQPDAERTAVDVHPLIGEVLRALRLPSNPGIHVETVFAPHTPLALANATQLYQVFLNLVTNAVYAMREGGGRLEIHTQPATVTAEQQPWPTVEPGPYVRVSMRDSGSGMDAATMQQVFEPFFTTKAPGQGTGLGLAVVQSIMAEHGGAVAVASEPGLGTVFTLYLPAAEPVPVAGAASLAEAPPAPNASVLYVDDEEALVDVGMWVLTRMGYTVHGFHHAEDALAAFQATPDRFAIAVVDRVMPGIDGFALVRAMRVLRPSLPVVMLTGQRLPDDGALMRELHIHDMLVKPMALNQLGERLREILAMA